MDADTVSRTNGIDMSPSDATSVRRILLVEDDEVLRRNYETLLTAHRLSVYGCATKSDAIAAFSRETFDVIILDVTLGAEFEAGFVLCQMFREKRKLTPIIFLTERNEDSDRISGLRLGADDYLAKTVSGTYLAARVNALIRRVEALTGGATERASETSQIGASPLRIDERLSRAYWHEIALDLPLTQFWILKDLYEHAGEVRSTMDLMRAANITVQPNTVVVYIKACCQRACGYRWIDDGAF